MTVFLILFIISVSVARESYHQEKNIAIIGAGIGGTSAAYYLRELDADSKIKIDVYSKGPIGGRLATADIDGREYEVGGSILHPRNKYMADFADKFGFKKKAGISGKFGLHDGKQFIFKEGEWGVLNFLKLMWRYGLSIPRVSYIISNMLGMFDKVYELQDRGKSFENVSSLLKAMDESFVRLTEVSLHDYLRSEGISDVFIEEIAQAIMRVNYCQTIKKHSLVGSVSLAGAEPNLWAVSGGNKRIPEALLNSSGANSIKAHVKAIVLQSDGKFALEMNEESDRVYDAVIVATPLTSETTDIKIKGLDKELTFPGKLHRTVCTLVSGKLNETTFGKDSIDEVLTVTEGLWFNSIGRNYPVDSEEKNEDTPSVWKVFSDNRLTDEQLNILFKEKRSVHVTDWLAYPEYNANETLGDFVFHPGLFYVNSIEWAASAMEMSIIGGRNSALLAAEYIGIEWKEKQQQRLEL